LSPHVEFVDLPCIDGDFVTVKNGLRHPDLEEPLAFLGGEEVVPLLKQIRAGMTLAEAVQTWSRRVPFNRGVDMAQWFVRHGLLVPLSPISG
jgi:hypothetical protein